MEDYYHYYQRADNLLKLIAEKTGKKIRIQDVPKFYTKHQGIEILSANKLIEFLNDSDRQILHVTPLGEQHLISGGFTRLKIGPPRLPNTTFKKHLEDNVNLLTIFGIFNALILFTGQGKEIDPHKLDLFNNGMQFISVSMYILSILVLIELINNTIDTDNKSWKFKTFEICLLSTTAGIGFIFLDKYFDLLIGLGFVSAALIIAGIIAGILGLIKYILPKHLIKVLEKQKQAVVFIQILSGLIITYFLIKNLPPLFKH